MRVAVPTEVKDDEFRVAITPAGVRDLVSAGHQVIVQSGAGLGSAITDEAYAAAGAVIAPDADATWSTADLVVKVKDPVESEYRHFREGLVLFAYLHLAAERALAERLLASGVTAIAYETVRLASGALPLLAPMSEVAGRLAPLVGAQAMFNTVGGSGKLLGGVPGTYPSTVVVLGCGVAGSNAAAMSVGLGADVTVLDTDLQRLRTLDARFAGRVRTVASNAYEIERALLTADLVIGSVLIPGARAPKLVSSELVSRMRPRSVLVDIAIDQGGCFEDSRPTTHTHPTFRVHDAILYCVTNMPGAVAHTSTFALTNATMPYTRALADLGWREAMRADPALAAGLNTSGGRVVNAAVASALDLPHTPSPDVLG